MNTMEQHNNEIYHYGVLGMKWGVRKNPNKAYVKANKKQIRLDQRVKSAKVFKKDYEEQAEKHRNNIRDLENENKVAKARFELSANDYSRKKHAYEDNQGNDFLGIKEHAYNRARKEYENAKFAYNDGRERLNKAILDLDRSEENVRRWAQSIENNTRRAERWRKAMNDTFSNIPEDSIAEGKAIIDRYIEKNKKYML